MKKDKEKAKKESLNVQQVGKVIPKKIKKKILLMKSKYINI